MRVIERISAVEIRLPLAITASALVFHETAALNSKPTRAGARSVGVCLLDRNICNFFVPYPPYIRHEHSLPSSTPCGLPTATAGRTPPQQSQPVKAPQPD